MLWLDLNRSTNGDVTPMSIKAHCDLAGFRIGPFEYRAIMAIEAERAKQNG